MALAVFLQLFLVVGPLVVFLWKTFFLDTFEEGSVMKTCGMVFKIMYSLFTTRIGAWYTRNRFAKAKTEHPAGHSSRQTFTYGRVQVLPIPVGSDNYAYAIVDSQTNDTVLVDVGDAESVQTVLSENFLKPTALLCTHRHWDHCEGQRAMKSWHPGLEVYGSKIDSPRGTTKYVGDNDDFGIGQLSFTSLLIPGHTRGHVAFVLHADRLDKASPKMIFTGDTLFLGCIGKLFECSAKTMLGSLDRLCEYPLDTLIWPGHEYADENLQFAATVDRNKALLSKTQWVASQRAQFLPTCPSTLEEELAYNPFLRTHDTALAACVGVFPANTADHRTDEIENSAGEKATLLGFNERAAVLKELRRRKDNFAPK